MDRAVEIAVGSELRVGIVTLALIDTRPSPTIASAKIGVFCPPHLGVRPVKEPT